MFITVASFLYTGYRIFGVLGCVVITTVIISAAAVYRGVNGQHYSLLNHYISELGEVGVSRRAQVFNIGMMLAGLLFIPFTLGLGLTIDNLWGLLGSLAGLWAGVSCFLVGVFPMNNLTPHSRVAISYFRAGLVTILFFSIALFTQAPGSTVNATWTRLAGIPAIFSYASFLALSLGKKPPADAEPPGDVAVVQERPRYLLAPTLEWLVFITTIFWFLAVSISYR